MSQSALAALLGKKTTPSAPSATPTPASATVATPAAPVAAAPPPPPTPAPALAAATPASVAAAPASFASSAPTSAPAAAPAPAQPEPGPNAISTPTPEGSPPDTLAALLGDFTAASGKAPRVNPPQAASVLAGATAREVAGHPEPPEVPEEKIAPVAKPQAVLDAENAPKTRRTAAVVQVELDAALERITQLEAALVAGGEVAGKAIDIAQEGADGIMAEAVALIEALRAEAAVSLEDNRKAWARVAALEEQLEKTSVERVLGTPHPDSLDVADLCAALAERGFESTLRFVGAS